MLIKYTLQLFVLFPFSGFLLLIKKKSWGLNEDKGQKLYQPIGSIREFSSTATETRLSRPSPRMVAAFVKEICNVLGTTMHGLWVSICRLANSCVPMDS